MNEKTYLDRGVRVAVNPDGIPRAMKSFAHWLCWKAVPKEDGKLDKVPHDPKTGKRASSTDSRTWATFRVALEALEAGGYDGLGFVLSSADPFVVMDFDDCRDPETGETDTRVVEYVRRFEKRHVEASPSGTGAHLVTYGKLRGGAKKGAYEVYGQERFVTVTGVKIDA